MDKHKINKNKEKMFNFRTTILLTMFVVLSMLHTHTTEGKVQMIHRHHTRNNNNNNNDYNKHKDNADDVIKQNQQQHHHYHHHYHHQQPHLHTHSHHSHHESQQRKYAATPILEFTTSSSSAIQSDNEFLIKQQQKQQQQKQQQQDNNLQQYQQAAEEISFINDNKDEVYYKTIKQSTSSTSSTTSQPSFSIHLMKQDDNKIKSETLISNSIIDQHKRHRHYNRSIPMAQLKHHDTVADKSHSDSGRNSDSIDTTMIIDPSENTKWNIATDQKLITKQHVQQQHPNGQQQQQQRIQTEKYKPDYDREQHSKHIYEDYYGDEGDGDSDGNENIRYDDEDDTDEDDYIGDDNDNISYDDEKSLSDRSYARITRSQIDEDYADDEPYHNGINDLEMQSDAAPGTLTEQKYLEVGNERAVQQARERYILEQKKPRSPHELATEHWHRMIQATKCRKPMPRVIPVSNNTSKRYEPYATILHRCGDDTGCCGSTASVCTVKRYETVMVYVFSYDFNYRKEIEALPMQNHTECHCVNRGSLQLDSIPRDKRSGSRYFNHFQQRQRKHKPELQSQFHAQYQEHQQPQLQNTLACNCPKHFNVFEEDMEHHAHLPTPHSIFFTKCRCDCVISNQNCLRFKNGEEGFSLEDRKCILERKCKPPVCSYGDYNLRIGRCPNYKSHLLQMS